jgi:CubicO group peptidase (beta-lactamase class C family)
LLALTAVAAAATTRAGDIPVTGLPIPELAAVDQVVLQVMELEDLAGCTVGIMKNHRIVYQRGFGWRNANASVAMPENATMRLASVSKAMVLQIINDLITDGSLDGDRPVFDVGQEGGGILQFNPWPSLQDERVGEITSRHLRDMRVYWESDYAWDSIEIYEAMGFDPEISPPPLGIEDMTRYALGREMLLDPGLTELPEDFDAPWDGYAYMNFNYNVLILVIEEITGMSFWSYVYQNLLTRSMWVPATDLFQAHPFYQTGLREPHYFSGQTWQNVYDAEWPDVPAPYGGYNVEAMVGSSFINMSAAPLLTFMDQHEARWTGNMPGSSAIVKDSEFDPEVDIVVLCNDTSADGIAAQKVAAAIDDVIDNGVAWPSNRIDGQWVDWLGADPQSGVGSYDVPYGSVDWALSHSTSGTKLQFHPGDHPFTGVMKKRLRLKAPIGTVRIGTPGP